jgi:hypothetical protein
VHEIGRINGRKVFGNVVQMGRNKLHDQKNVVLIIIPGGKGPELK